jgi:hypothetical protein
MQTLKARKAWSTLAVFGILLLGISACNLYSELPEIPELPVRTLASPVANPTTNNETLEVLDLENNPYCNGEDVHPIGENISQTYDVTYEEVMRLYCSGFSFDNILLAFATSQQTDYDYNARELLQMNLTKNWDEIWNEIGVFEDE